ncbi:glycosyltransferase family 2 protein [Paenibacillus hamazuiensis]|uniref:glycosyltransferase family 2 protein n=1 Tax=Paenibacillus hamazuiensis TaxID=2936508 RepID=UPI00200EF386|nr:glycosyltransferase family 2 protein [Paenibacillus hamazuiensis]
MDYNIVIGLPAYNEEPGISKLLEKLSDLGSRFDRGFFVVIVNDGSTDGTENILHHFASRYPFISYLNHPHNKGLGEAVKTMFAYVCEHFNESDVLITLDADNTHNPGIIPEMVNKLKNEQLDLVIASRFTQGGKEIGLSLPRKLYSRGAALLLKMFFPIHNVKDYSSGYRCYRVGYLKQAMSVFNKQLVTATGFECMAEIIARFSKIGIKAGEYPLVLQYDLKENKSKMKVARTIAGYFHLIKKVNQMGALK